MLCTGHNNRQIQLWVAPNLSEVTTQTGPRHHEGRNGISVKPALPISPAAQPRACQEFLVTFVSQTKVTRPSACAASGAKQPLTLETLAVSQKKDENAYSGGFAPQIRALSSRRSRKHSTVGNSVRLLTPALIWDRVLTKAEAVSPLSPLVRNSCGPAACLSGIFGYFCFQDKSYSPISLRSKRGETAFDFRNSGVSQRKLPSRPGETAFDFRNPGVSQHKFPASRAKSHQSSADFAPAKPCL